LPDASRRSVCDSDSALLDEDRSVLLPRLLNEDDGALEATPLEAGGESQQDINKSEVIQLTSAGLIGHPDPAMKTGYLLAARCEHTLSAQLDFTQLATECCI